MKKTALPFLFLNMAMTADGKIATANRAISSFGSARDQAHLYELRATADAVMCGARTVDSDEVHLGPGAPKYRRQRLRHGLAEHHLRVVVSGSGTINPQAAIFQQRFSPIIILTTERAPRRRQAALRELAEEVRVCGEKEIDWPDTLAWLRRQWRVKRLLAEGGGELNDALFRAGLVRELHLTICPLVFGGRTAPTVAEGTGAASLADACPLELQSLRRVGAELFLVYRVGPAQPARKHGFRLASPRNNR
jgi:riboflavin-specific deaminase-like protein